MKDQNFKTALLKSIKEAHGKGCEVLRKAQETLEARKGEEAQALEQKLEALLAVEAAKERYRVLQSEVQSAGFAKVRAKRKAQEAQEALEALADQFYPLSAELGLLGTPEGTLESPTDTQAAQALRYARPVNAKLLNTLGE